MPRARPARARTRATLVLSVRTLEPMLASVWDARRCALWFLPSSTRRARGGTEKRAREARRDQSRRVPVRDRTVRLRLAAT
jgi:hypothetical protein